MESLRESYHKLYFKWIDSIKEFGVFTDSRINKGETVEICYCLPADPNDSFYKNFLFSIDDANEDFLAMGFGSIYNHSYGPNMVWKIEDIKLRVIKFVAIKDIEIGDELTHNYGTRWWENRKNLTYI
jgi:hypothetical protein